MASASQTHDALFRVVTIVRPDLPNHAAFKSLHMTLLHTSLPYPDAYPARSFSIAPVMSIQPSSTLGLGLGTSRPPLTFSGV